MNHATFKFVKGKRLIDWRVGVIVQGNSKREDYMLRVRRWCWTCEELLMVEGEYLSLTERVCYDSIGHYKRL
jgi:hypothetical protein